MIHFRCQCGRQLQAREGDVGRLAVCPLCRHQSVLPESDQPRHGAGTVSLAASQIIEGGKTTSEPLRPTAPPCPDAPAFLLQRPSKKAVLSLLLGVPPLLLFAAAILLLAPWSCLGVVSLLALVLGISAFRDIVRSRGELSGKGPAIAGIVLGCLGLLGVPTLELTRKWAREERIRHEDRMNLLQLAHAMHNHHDDRGHVPAATAYRTRDGTPGLSWRVALLPYIEQDNLFKQFRLDEPWDSPHNIRLLPRMPRTYRHPLQKDDGTAGLTHYQVFVGPGTPFEPRQPPGQRVPEVGPRIPGSFPLGTHTILIATAREPVPWTKPADLVFDPDQPLPLLGVTDRDGFHIASASTHIEWIPKGTPEHALRARTSWRSAPQQWLRPPRRGGKGS